MNDIELGSDMRLTASSMPTRGRILIVDDEANAREALAELLADEGYETATASDGQKAVPLLASF
ncbi:MAG: hypothetical protein H5U40_11145, partial [Polyangiaceae bacterium]|nr:hypothetical protein [Polyangiaceae bacterium]